MFLWMELGISDSNGVLKANLMEISLFKSADHQIKIESPESDHSLDMTHSTLALQSNSST